MTPVQTIPGVRVGSGDCDKPVLTWPRGRVCAHEGCDAVLSMYNRDDCCSLHTGSTTRRSGAHVVTDAAECAVVLRRMRGDGMSYCEIGRRLGIHRELASGIVTGTLTTVCLKTAAKILKGSG